MSIQAMKWAWAQKDLTPTQKLVLLALADRANDSEGQVAWPKVSTIAKDTGLAGRTVSRTCNQLRDKGLIRVVSDFRDDGSQKQNLYFLLLGGGRKMGLSVMPPLTLCHAPPDSVSGPIKEELLLEPLLEPSEETAGKPTVLGDEMIDFKKHVEEGVESVLKAQSDSEGLTLEQIRKKAQKGFWKQKGGYKIGTIKILWLDLKRLHNEPQVPGLSLKEASIFFNTQGGSFDLVDLFDTAFRHWGKIAWVLKTDHGESNLPAHPSSCLVYRYREALQLIAEDSTNAPETGDNPPHLQETFKKKQINDF